MRKSLTCIVAAIVMAASAEIALAQSADAPPAPAAPAAAYTDAQLDQLVAPVALYPDPLLADVLMAATYPLEIVEAARWADADQAMSDVDRAAALDQQPWHASVKSLVATPTVLDMMNAQLAWTQNLGSAVLADESGVMAAVQRLRQQAQASGTLKSTDQQTVTVQVQESQRIVVIQPAVAGIVYVPYYDPFVVWRPWRWPTWPPYYFPPRAGVIAFGSLDVGFAFGFGFRFDGIVVGGFDWWRSDITLRWHINVGGVADQHVESWHHDLNDRHSDFPPPDRAEGAGFDPQGDKGETTPAADAGKDGGSADGADGGDGFDGDRPDRHADGNRADDDGGLDDDAQHGEGRHMDGLDDDDEGFRDQGFRNDGFGGGGRFGWRRPYDWRLR